MEQINGTMLPMMLPSGGDDMVTGDLWHEVHTRFKLKEPKKAIARSLGISVPTVRKILKQPHYTRYERRQCKRRVLAPFEAYARMRLPAVGYCAQSVYEELKERGYTGSYDMVKRFVRPFREDATREATIRFETPPGRQGQVDWGTVWTLLDGKRTKVHLFVMTLGYSRRMFAHATDTERLPAFLSCHTQAFDWFGGLPHELLYDNTRTVVLSRDVEGRHIEWNPTFFDFAQYYGFRPRLHRPYRAQTKGKVESGIKYAKRFLRGKSFYSLEQLNSTLSAWTTGTADTRIHGTIHRRPADVFLEEQHLLLSHNGKPAYTIQERFLRHVSKDCMVTVETNRYSVPFRYAGRPVEVQAVDGTVLIYHKDTCIARHHRLDGRYRITMENEHYAGLFLRERPIVPDVEVRDLAVYDALAEGGAL